MAHFEVEIDTDFVKELTRLGERSEIIAQLMMDDAAQIMQDALESELRMKHKETGDLADSIEADVFQDAGGNWVVFAHPTGRAKKKRSRGKSYARSKSGRMTSGRSLYNDDKLWWIEMGNSRQPPKPFIERMCRSIEGEIKANMQAIFDREVGK